VVRGVASQVVNPACSPTQTPDQVDIPALREKYRFERDKRVRKEGSRQYVELSDDFASFYETDPCANPWRRTSMSPFSAAALPAC
jgi:cyclohexanone monooxygenase